MLSGGGVGGEEGGIQKNPSVLEKEEEEEKQKDEEEEEEEERGRGFRV